MKNLLRYLLIALAFATTGLFAQAATDSPAAAPQSQRKVVKKGKKTGKKGKGHKKHQKHKKKQAK
jgi:hypothetical protein